MRERKQNILVGILYAMMVPAILLVLLLGIVKLTGGRIHYDLITSTLLLGTAVSFYLNTKVFRDRGEYFGRGVILGVFICAIVWVILFLMDKS